MILRSVFTIRVYFVFFMPCQKCVFDNLGCMYGRKRERERERETGMRETSMLMIDDTYCQQEREVMPLQRRGKIGERKRENKEMKNMVR